MFRKTRRKTPVPESLLNKVAGLQHATVLKKWLSHRCFPVHFTIFLRSPHSKITSERLLLFSLSIRKNILNSCNLYFSEFSLKFSLSLSIPHSHISHKLNCISSIKWLIPEYMFKFVYQLLFIVPMKNKPGVTKQPSTVVLK